MLVLHGDEDELNPTANAQLMADRVPGARLQLVAGARHAYFEERRDVACSPSSSSNVTSPETT